MYGQKIATQNTPLIEYANKVADDICNNYTPAEQVDVMTEIARIVASRMEKGIFELQERKAYQEQQLNRLTKPFFDRVG